MSKNIVIDLHLDMLYDVEKKRRAGRRRVIETDYLPSFCKGGLTAVVSSLYTDSDLPDGGLRATMNQIAALHAELAESPQLVLATCSEDILRAQAEDKFAIMLGFEGIEPLLGNVDMLRTFYVLGVRILGICWSRSNWAADGSRFFDFNYEGYGLTEGGKALVDLATEIGMIIDVSHINDKGFDDVMARTTKPVIATHSNCRSLSNTPRNLDDGRIKQIADRGGVIGTNGANLLARISDPANATMRDLADHKLHIRKVGGSHALALGLDQCDRINDAMDSSFGRVFDIIPDYSMLPEYGELLLSLGLTEEEVRGAMGENAFRVIKEVLG